MFSERSKPCLNSRPVCVSAAVHFEEFKCGRVSWKDVNGVGAALELLRGASEGVIQISRRRTAMMAASIWVSASSFFLARRN